MTRRLALEAVEDTPRYRSWTMHVITLDRAHSVLSTFSSRRMHGWNCTLYRFFSSSAFREMSLLRRFGETTPLLSSKFRFDPFGRASYAKHRHTHRFRSIKLSFPRHSHTHALLEALWRKQRLIPPLHLTSIFLYTHCIIMLFYFIFYYMFVFLLQSVLLFVICFYSFFNN